MKEKPPILVWHAEGHRYAEALRQRLPEAPIDVVEAVDRDSGRAAGRAATGAVPATGAESATGTAPATAPEAAARAEAEVLLAWKVPEGELEGMPRLRWVQVSGAGVDHFLGRHDLGEEVLLTRSLGRFGIQVAEYVAGYLLHHLLAIDRYREQQRRQRWQRGERRLLADRTVGVIGLGSLGLPVARLLGALGARVLGVRRSGEAIEGIEDVFSAKIWRTLLPRCDALVVAAPRTFETVGMIDAEALAALPRGAVLINIARGDLVDEAALLAALESGHLGAAVLDVFATEPLPADHPLWDQPAAWITPHIAAPSEIDVIADEFAENYRRFVQGRGLLNVVNRARGY